MLPGLAIPSVLCLIWFSRPALACKFICSLQPCNRTRSSDAMFIGTLESMEPVFLSRWSPSSQLSMISLNEAYIDARQHPSDGSSARLKDAYRRAFPDLTGDRQGLLQNATPKEPGKP